MISVDVEKEIQQENKVVAGLSARKAVCVGIAGAVGILLTLLLPFEISMYPLVLIGAACFYFGWGTKSGLTPERRLLKRLQESLYHNSKRKYRTKNRYFTLMNKEYARHMSMDMTDKKVQKDVKREAKGTKQRMKQSKLKVME